MSNKINAAALVCTAFYHPPYSQFIHNQNTTFINLLDLRAVRNSQVLLNGSTWRSVIGLQLFSTQFNLEKSH
jgi:hypothetical protein